MTDNNAYATSIPSRLERDVPDDQATIRSCEFGVEGGPALGTFVVTQKPGEQWLIIGHRSGPRVCPSTTR